LNSITRIAEAAKVHKSLAAIKLRRIGEAVARELPALFQADTGVLVKKLNLRGNRISNTDAAALSLPLKDNRCLKELNLTNNEIGGQGATAIAAALRSNVGLEKICLDHNPIGDDGAVALAQALTSNTTLTSLSLSGLSEKALVDFAECLPLMNGLKHLDLQYLKGLTKDGAATFLKGIKANTELEQVAFADVLWVDPCTKKLSDELAPQIQYQMALNRAGKRILKSQGHVPDSLWPLVLAGSSNNPDALYFFLREKPDVLINKPPPPSPTRVSKAQERFLVQWMVLSD
jgi:hypothetical protein